MRQKTDYGWEEQDHTTIVNPSFHVLRRILRMALTEEVMNDTCIMEEVAL